MKFLETHFEDYVKSVELYNLHPLLKKNFPDKIENMQNMILELFRKHNMDWSIIRANHKVNADLVFYSDWWFAIEFNVVYVFITIITF